MSGRAPLSLLSSLLLLLFSGCAAPPEPTAELPASPAPEDDAETTLGRDDNTAPPYGGWRVVQRTVWDPNQSLQLLTDYEAWLSQDVVAGGEDDRPAYRLQGSAWPDVAEGRELRLVIELRQEDGTACAPLTYQGRFTSLEVDEAGATLTGLGADVPIVAGTALSALGHGDSAYCVEDYEIAPWFLGGCCATCPTAGGGSFADGEAHPAARNYPALTPDAFGLTMDDVCTGEVVTGVAANFYGVDTMEIWLR